MYEDSKNKNLETSNLQFYHIMIFMCSSICLKYTLNMSIYVIFYILIMYGKINYLNCKVKIVVFI